MGPIRAIALATSGFLLAVLLATPASADTTPISSTSPTIPPPPPQGSVTFTVPDFMYPSATGCFAYTATMTITTAVPADEFVLSALIANQSGSVAGGISDDHDTIVWVSDGHGGRTGTGNPSGTYVYSAGTLCDSIDGVGVFKVTGTIKFYEANGTAFVAQAPISETFVVTAPPSPPEPPASAAVKTTPRFTSLDGELNRMGARLVGLSGPGVAQLQVLRRSHWRFVKSVYVNSSGVLSTRVPTNRRATFRFYWPGDATTNPAASRRISVAKQ